MTTVDDTAPHWPRQQLQAWVDEFLAGDVALDGTVAVIDQEEPGNLSLVVVHLAHAPASMYMQPGAGDSSWKITLTSRADDLTLDPDRMTALGDEVAAVGQLCTFLQRRASGDAAF